MPTYPCNIPTACDFLDIILTDNERGITIHNSLIYETTGNLQEYETTCNPQEG